MNLVLLIIATLLFVLLSPGAFLRLPANGSKFIVLGVHALVFFIVMFFLGDTLTNAVARLM